MKKLKASRFPEYFVLFFFAAAYIVITVFHEPWFDEAQAWQIAKCASVKEILFDIPHYEGHPPLWYLILAIPAKLGLPYEPSLKSVGFLFAAASVYLIVFKSPFPRIIRLLLPFNYFIFYQYGVIVRPYGLILFLLLCLAAVFSRRNEKPWSFGAVLMLLCVSHSYGILIAGGVSICFLWDMLEEKGAERFFREFFRDRRIRMLAGLLLWALLIIADIFPREDTYAFSTIRRNSFFRCFLCTVFSMLPENFITSMGWGLIDDITLQEADISTGNLIVIIIVGAFFWFAVFCCSSKKSFKYFAVPYLLFSVFGAAVYFTAHHEGVSLGILMFWGWITLEDEDRFAHWKAFRAKLSKNDAKLLSRAAVGVGLLCLLIPIYWTATASVHDIRENYGCGRDAAKFLKDTGLENALIFRPWTMPNEGGGNQPLFCNADSTILAYFDRNIYANVNGGDKEKAYTEHLKCSKEQIAQLIEDWRKIGIPDVMIGYADMSDVYEGEISISDYSPVYLAFSRTMYKDQIAKHFIPILLRNDLLDSYDVEVQDVSDYFTGHYKITDEMIEAYRNGEITIDEIVDSTLGDFGKG